MTDLNAQSVEGVDPSEELASRIQRLESEVDDLRMNLAMAEAVRNDEREEADELGAPLLDRPEVMPTDQACAVDTFEKASYLAKTRSKGILRTDTTIDYTSAVDGTGLRYVQLTCASLPVLADSGPPGAGLLDGDYHGQIMWWDQTNGVWKLTTAPTSPAVLVFDPDEQLAGGNLNTVRWETIATLYEGVVRDSDAEIQDGWVRAHA